MSGKKKKSGSNELIPEQDAKHENPRRRLLRAVAAGGGVAVGLKSLPRNWSDPVVDAVVLPAHAQTSDGLSDPCNSVVQPIDDSSFNVLVTGTVVGSGNLSGIQIDVEGTHGDVTRSNSGSTDGGGNYSIQIGPFDCNDPNGTGTVNVVVTSPDPRLAGQEAECPVSTNKCLVKMQG